jgi:hypothetical protein
MAQTVVFKYFEFLVVYTLGSIFEKIQENSVTELEIPLVGLP